MSSHTPGPWHYSKGGQIKLENGRLLASAWYPSNMPDAKEERQDGESWLDASNRLAPERDRIEAEMEVNARLIAAAPTMADYINRRADAGDAEAAKIMGVIHA